MKRSGMRQSPDISKVKEITSSQTPDDNNIFDNFLRLSLAKLIDIYNLINSLAL